VAAFARSRVQVLVRGESGTGKELIARAIHELSGRAGAFVAVNCAALTSTLLEAELFGYRKGAFTGAVEDRPGYIRSSDRGTLFLDEIGDLPLPAQAALLRVLQEEEVHPVGATRPTPIDLRVVAATHRDVAELAKQERFRPDLLARLDGGTVVLPPLRARREDLGLICASLLRKMAGDHAAGVSFKPEAARALLLFGWPTNVRQLEKCLAVALALKPAGGRIGVEHLKDDVIAAPKPVATAPMRDDDRRLRDELTNYLREHKGNVTAVARAMGKARTQVQRWLRRFDIRPDSFIQ
jgi:transcriptional regulator with PAS, ATPase and Fis domain